MLSVKEMIELNNEKRELLTKENKQYYENMLVYLRTSYFREERTTEEVLLEMLDHLIEAQKEGKSAEDVFGKSPKELAEEINQSLPNESWKEIIDFSIETFLSCLSWICIIIGVFSYFKFKIVDVPIIPVLLFLVVLTVTNIGFVYFAFRLIKNNAFCDDKRLKRQAWAFGIVDGIIIIAIILAFKLIGPFGPKFEFSYYTILGLGCFFLLASFLLKKMRKAR